MNVVDSCGWLEYIANGANTGFFEPAWLDLPHLIVPAISLYEVYKRVLVQRGQAFADRAMAAMEHGQVVQLDASGMRLAAIASQQHKLAMADAIIWQTAQLHQATLWTQDADLQHLPGVQYRPKA